MSGDWQPDGPIGEALTMTLCSLPQQERLRLLNSRIELCELAVVSRERGLGEHRCGTGEYCPVRPQLVRSIGAQWWGDPFRPGYQSHLSRADTAPRWEPVGNSDASHLASKPAGGVWTSTMFAGGTSAWLLHPESEGDGTWQLVPSGRTHVRAVSLVGPEDWIGLCSAFPRVLESGQLVPDWIKVAAKCDVVHLTMAGLVSIQDRKMETTLGPVAMNGWDVESACWLRPPDGGWQSLVNHEQPQIYRGGDFRTVKALGPESAR